MSLRCAKSRFAKPRCSLRGRTGCHFLRCAKRTKKHTGRSPATHDSKLCRKRFCKNFHFHKPKGFLFQKALRTLLKNRFFMYKKPFIRTNLSLFPSKATFFHPPSPVRTTLNLLFAKNTAILWLFALNPYAVKPEPRTDSNHCRRYPENCCFLRCRLPDECRSFSQKHRIDRRFESSPESRGSQTSGVLFGSFCTTQKARKNVPFPGSSEVLQTSNQRTAMAASHRNN